MGNFDELFKKQDARREIIEYRASQFHKYKNELDEILREVAKFLLKEAEISGFNFKLMIYTNDRYKEGGPYWELGEDGASIIKIKIIGDGNHVKMVLNPQQDKKVGSLLDDMWVKHPAEVNMRLDTKEIIVGINNLLWPVGM